MMFTLNFNISINSLEFQYFLIINYIIWLKNMIICHLINIVTTF